MQRSLVWTAAAVLFWIVFYLTMESIQLFVIYLHFYALATATVFSVVAVCGFIPVQWIFKELNHGDQRHLPDVEAADEGHDRP